MTIVIFVDRGTKHEYYEQLFESEGYLCKAIDTVNESIDVLASFNEITRKILIWHISSSSIMINGETLKIELDSTFAKGRELLDDCNFDFKYAVTDNDQNYVDIIRLTKWFDDTDNWTELRYRFQNGLEKGLYSSEKIIRKTIISVISTLFPLAIKIATTEKLMNFFEVSSVTTSTNKEKDILLSYFRKMINSTHETAYKDNITEAMSTLINYLDLDRETPERENLFKNILRAADIVEVQLQMIVKLKDRDAFQVDLIHVEEFLQTSKNFSDWFFLINQLAADVFKQ